MEYDTNLIINMKIISYKNIIFAMRVSRCDFDINYNIAKPQVGVR